MHVCVFVCALYFKAINGEMARLVKWLVYKTEGLGLSPYPYEKPGKMMYIYNPRARDASKRTPSLLAS